MNPLASLLTVSGILLGFLFAGFWWILNREISFTPQGRHFKLSYWLIFLAATALAVFGVLMPLYRITAGDRFGQVCCAGVSGALILVFGYMLAELGHYGVFAKPHYITRAERWIVVSTLISAVLIFGIVVW